MGLLHDASDLACPVRCGADVAQPGPAWSARPLPRCCHGGTVGRHGNGRGTGARHPITALPV
nr:hypothetical protein RVX_0943 [Nitratidesulfovibrio sp. HK-II]